MSMSKNVEWFDLCITLNDDFGPYFYLYRCNMIRITHFGKQHIPNRLQILSEEQVILDIDYLHIFSIQVFNGYELYNVDYKSIKDSAYIHDVIC